MRQHKQAAKDAAKRIVVGLLLIVMTLSLLVPVFATDVTDSGENSTTDQLIVSSGEVIEDMVDVGSNDVETEIPAGTVTDGEPDETEDGEVSEDPPETVVTIQEDEQEATPAEEPQKDGMSIIMIAMIIVAAIAAVMLLAVIFVVMHKLREPGKHEKNNSDTFDM